MLYSELLLVSEFNVDKYFYDNLNLFFSADGMTFSDVVYRFNANISYSGLLHAVTGDVSFNVKSL